MERRQHGANRISVRGWRPPSLVTLKPVPHMPLPKLGDRQCSAVFAQIVHVPYDF
jgi:hypothetical protein